jgi:uncharacterized protein
VKRLHFSAIAALLVLASSSLPANAQFSFGQPQNERQVQANLPQSRAPLWRTLMTTRIAENASTGMFSASHTPAVRALANTTITITGFMLPLDTDTRSRHFLLSRMTPVCFFHPPGAPNEVIEVYSATPIAITDKLVTVTGRFTLISDPEKGLFFRLSNAQASVVR